MALTSSQKEAVIDRLQVLIPDLPDGADGLLAQLADDAAEYAEAYTARTSIPDQLLRTVGDLALVAYNRMGTEGEAGRSEGGESYTFETAPAQIHNVLNRYRLARVGGTAHEAANTAEG